MSDRSNHTVKGWLFVAICCVFAAIIYFAVRRDASGPTAAAETNLAMTNEVAADVTPLSSDEDDLAGVRPPKSGSDADVPTSDEPAQDTVFQRVFPQYVFQAYAATGWTGTAVAPRFAGQQARFATFRTLIRDAAEQGPTFAGYMTVVMRGCGSECVQYMLLDQRSGMVQDFSPADEDAIGHVLDYRRDSNLLFDSYRVSSDDGVRQCVFSAYRWDGQKMVVLATERRPLAEDAYDCS